MFNGTTHCRWPFSRDTIDVSMLGMWIMITIDDSVNYVDYVYYGSSRTKLDDLGVPPRKPPYVD